METIFAMESRTSLARKLNSNFAESSGGGGEVSTAWGDITDKPSVIAAGETAAAARTAIGAGTSNLQLGTTASTAAAGNHTHGDASASASGFMTSAQFTKLAGIATGANNYTLPAAGAAIGGVKKGAAVPDSVATDIAGLVADLNALLASLRGAGVIA